MASYGFREGNARFQIPNLSLQILLPKRFEIGNHRTGIRIEFLDSVLLADEFEVVRGITAWHIIDLLRVLKDLVLMGDLAP